MKIWSFYEIKLKHLLHKWGLTTGTNSKSLTDKEKDPESIITFQVPILMVPPGLEPGSAA